MIYELGFPLEMQSSVTESIEPQLNQFRYFDGREFGADSFLVR